ncbi:MAG: TlpA family protein disulfide reductase [Planctomycetes bacterium]|nr:TlpA family protein disulfide reductase [Planctomycetota bacterium]
MARLSRVSVFALVVGLAVPVVGGWTAAVSAAQEAVPPAPAVEPKDGAAPAPAPAQPADAPPDAAKVAARMADLYAIVAQEPASVAPGETDTKKRAELNKARDAWEASVRSLSEAADQYAAALKAPGAEGAQRRTLFWGGWAKMQLADRLAKDEAQKTRAAAADLLRAALDGAPPEADWRPDSEFWLGRALVFQVEAGRATPDEAATHLREAAILLTKQSRGDEAGRAASAALRMLTVRGLDGAARDFASAVDADKANFGQMTSIVRALARRSSTGVGQKLFGAGGAGLPDAADSEGKPVKWADFAGAPLIVHFFHDGWATGRPSGQRDVETLLRPLYDRLQPKGLRMVGVSMDFALTKERIETIKKQWDEWGVKDQLRDGSLDSVRKFADEQGITWPWIWDGLWDKNPIAQALGGPGASAAHAVLIDKDGVIRWRGDAPFQGLAEATDAAMK